MQKSKYFYLFFDFLIVVVLAYLFLVPSSTMAASTLDLVLNHVLRVFLALALGFMGYKNNLHEFTSLLKATKLGLRDAFFSFLLLALIYISALEFLKMPLPNAPSPLELGEAIFFVWTFGIFGPVFEELFFRAILIDRLEAFFRSKSAAYALSTIIFAALHLGSGLFGFGFALIAGILFTLLRHRYKSITAPIIAHCLFNTLSIILYMR